eukprot:356666-Chlamydomonas_euryale.AAC.2
MVTRKTSLEFDAPYCFTRVEKQATFFREAHARSSTTCGQTVAHVLTWRSCVTTGKTPSLRLERHARCLSQRCCPPALRRIADLGSTSAALPGAGCPDEAPMGATSQSCPTQA